MTSTPLQRPPRGFARFTLHSLPTRAGDNMLLVQLFDRHSRRRIGEPRSDLERAAAVVKRLNRGGAAIQQPVSATSQDIRVLEQQF